MLSVFTRTRSSLARVRQQQPSTAGPQTGSWCGRTKQAKHLRKSNPYNSKAQRSDSKSRVGESKGNTPIRERSDACN